MPLPRNNPLPSLDDFNKPQDSYDEYLEDDFDYIPEDLDSSMFSEEYEDEEDYIQLNDSDFGIEEDEYEYVESVDIEDLKNQKKIVNTTKSYEPEYDDYEEYDDVEDDYNEPYYDEYPEDEEEENDVPPAPPVKKGKIKKGKPKGKEKPPKAKISKPKIDLSSINFDKLKEDKKLLIGTIVGAVLILFILIFLISSIFSGGNSNKLEAGGATEVKLEVDYPYANVTADKKRTGVIQVLYKHKENGKYLVCETPSNDYNKKEKRVEFGCLNLYEFDNIDNYEVQLTQFIED